MTIKQLTQGTVAMICCILLLSCKKENPLEVEKYGLLNITNATTYADKDIFLTYNGIPYKGITFADIKIPAGSGKLSITNTAGPFLEASLNVEANTLQDLVLFQPNKDVPPAILENDLALVPRPDAEHIKIKLANFMYPAFPRPFDVIVSWLDPNTGDIIDGGRIDNIGKDFPDVFNELLFKEKTNEGVGIIFMFVDHDTQQPLLDDVYTIFGTTNNERILTLYITEEKDGAIVTGTPYKIAVRALFLH